MALLAAKTTKEIAPLTSTDKQGQSSDGFGASTPGLRSQTAAPTTGYLYAGKVKPAELILFTTQLSVMLDSGV
ncbi:MAG: hypothetical protein NTX52_05970, partial [Planctomycetota bacterium]|nr:hypothetical protein [Planctomycetota bacterium]